MSSLNIQNINKNVLYFGSFIPVCMEEYIWKQSIESYGASSNTFQHALIDGLKENKFSFDILTVPSVGSFPLRYKKLFVPRNCNSGKNEYSCGYLNLTYFKSYSIYFNALRIIEKWVRKSIYNRIIIVYSLLPEYINSALAVKRKYGDVVIIVIVLDLPEFFGVQDSLIKKVISKQKTKQAYKYLNLVDGFVVLTKDMALRLDILDKPWVLIEGIYKETALHEVGDKFSYKTILYSGSLDKRFGIELLLKAFMEIKGNYRLLICGQGDMSSYVKECASIDKRILFLGLLQRDEVLRLQVKSTLLINPRKEGEYTKFSFPSKTMEYMASGTPVLMYHLECIPPEYDDYLIYIHEGVGGIKTTILEWIDKDINELNEFGKRAKDFIVRNKNNIHQSKKLIELVKYLKRDDNEFSEKNTVLY